MRRFALIWPAVLLAPLLLSDPAIAGCAEELKALKERFAQAPRSRTPGRDAAQTNIAAAESALGRGDEKACLEAVRRGSASLP